MWRPQCLRCSLLHTERYWFRSRSQTGSSSRLRQSWDRPALLSRMSPDDAYSFDAPCKCFAYILRLRLLYVRAILLGLCLDKRQRFLPPTYIVRRVTGQIKVFSVPEHVCLEIATLAPCGSIRRVSWLTWRPIHSQPIQPNLSISVPHTRQSPL